MNLEDSGDSPGGISSKPHRQPSVASSRCTAPACCMPPRRGRSGSGLIGCGGRGTGAAIDCVEASPDVVITAMGDLFPDSWPGRCNTLQQKLTKENLTVTPETCFTGFDAYKKVMAADVDLVILAAPPFFRPQHLQAAVRGGEARVHGETCGCRPGRRTLGDRQLRARRPEETGASSQGHSAGIRHTTSK